MSKSSKPRWNRIESLSEEDQNELLLLTDNTKGMTVYGHRARTSVMLPLPLASHIAALAREKDLSIGQVIVDLLEGQRQEK